MLQDMLRRATWAAAIAALALTTGLGGPHTASAEESGGFLGLDLNGSLGEGRHSRYVPPLTNPIWNETPYITTEVRPFYFHHALPDDFVTNGGEVNLVALQLRLAITERLGFIATKDGYADFDFDSVLEDEDGFANIAAGLKYALITVPEDEAILTAGARYEIPINDLESSGIELQGAGDGFVNVFLTGARAFGDFGLQASVGSNFALDTDNDTSFVHWSLHGDYELLPGLFPLLEINGFHAFNNADRLTGPLGDLDGVDVLNFGSEDRGTTITFGGGARYRLTENFQFGLGAETPITDKDDTIFDYRVYFDLVASF